MIFISDENPVSSLTSDLCDDNNAAFLLRYILSSFILMCSFHLVLFYSCH